MRALVAALLLAGCGAAGDGAGTPDMLQPPTGLVVALHYDHNNVVAVVLSGAAYASGRRFGPYTVSEQAMPPDRTVGFVFDASDAGRAMICGETHDVSGKVLATGCDTFAVHGQSVAHDDLTLDDVNSGPTH